MNREEFRKEVVRLLKEEGVTGKELEIPEETITNAINMNRKPEDVVWAWTQ